MTCNHPSLRLGMMQKTTPKQTDFSAVEGGRSSKPPPFTTSTSLRLTKQRDQPSQAHARPGPRERQREWRPLKPHTPAQDTASILVHRRGHAKKADPRSGGGSVRARVLARSVRKSMASELHLPPVSRRPQRHLGDTPGTLPDVPEATPEGELQRESKSSLWTPLEDPQKNACASSTP